MAIVQCHECGREVSTEAVSCPGCGAPGPQYRQGRGFEWKSRTSVFGIPLVHVAFGHTARRKPRVAKGIIAIGQFGIGVVTIAQFGFGALFGFGQFIFGLVAVAQFAGGILAGIGQFATGVFAVGQLVVGVWGLCQGGWAFHIWSPTRQDMEAVAMFSTILMKVKGLFGIP